ncbi:MAG: AAA family ATPase [Firmicutes bacterium]|nr:AAA family ATPase [Bacillota bacterium]MBV1727041.1 AAA family ATPase [Desulforudis sp.]MBV1734525.1 AAA family ATPase [Desulforudis sp.]
MQGDKYTIARQERQKHVDAVVRARDRKKLVVAGPGTGKTHLFKAVLEEKDNTLTLTFVNALVADLSLELFGLSDVKTLHGFARSQLGKATLRTVKVFPKLSEVIRQDAGILLGDSVNFDYLFHNRKDTDSRVHFYKKRRMYYDHYGFSDLVYAAVLYFEQNEERIPFYSQVLVDEFQDFNTLEVSLIDLLARRSPVLLAGDDDQALYESLKNASPRHIRQRYAGETGGYACFTLPYCSRSTRVIVEATNDIITSAKAKGLLLGRIDKPFRYFQDAKKDAASDANPHIVHSHVYSKQLPWFIKKHITDITQQLRAEFTVLILSPTRTQCQGIYEALKSKGFQNVYFAEKTDSTPSLLDGLKLLLQDSKCNLGWRIVSKELLDGPTFDALLGQSDVRGETETDKLAKMVSQSLKKQVEVMLSDLRRVRDGRKLVDNQVSELLSKIGIDAFGAATQSLQGELKSANQPLADPGIRRTPIVVTTIQSSKGLAADYVFITHFDDRYCVRDRDNGISDQDVCSFVVALTRAGRKVYLLSTDRSQTATFLTWIDKGRICEVRSPGQGEQ